MSDSKYSNTLTVFLIIAIIGILGLLIFLGIDAVNKMNLDKQTSEAVSKFDELVPSINTNTSQIVPDSGYDFIFSNDTTNNTTANEIADPFSNLPEGNGTETEAPETVPEKKVMYKGFVQVGNISIPSTSTKLPVLEKATKSAIEVAVAIQTGPGLNKVGNTVIAGHNYRNGTLFSDNKNIKIGDKVYIKDNTGSTVTYVVYEKYETTPDDASYINRDTEGKREITLYTCNDDSSMRIIIKAREQ